MNDDKRDLTNHKIRESNSSVYAYDYAFVNDLRARFKQPHISDLINSNVQITAPQQAFRIMGELGRDKSILPFISLERTGWSLSPDNQEYQTFIGSEMYEYDDKNGNKVKVNAQIIPITINYKLSVWTSDRITNDNIIRELIFYYNLRPSLIAYIDNNLHIGHKFNLYFDNEISDNSDIANHTENGNLFRQDLTLYTDSSYLWKARTDDVVKISPEINFYYDV